LPPLLAETTQGVSGCHLQEMSGEKSINVRIGMHSGAVTAGVVGFKVCIQQQVISSAGCCDADDDCSECASTVLY
jgi:hypothetical protein